MDDQTARRQAAREAVLQARQEAARPWWQRQFHRWFSAVPSRLRRSLRWWGRELGSELSDLLLAVAALVFVAVAGLLVVAAYEAAPIPTLVLVAGCSAFLIYGGVEFFRERRRGRLATAAVAAFGFVALWVAAPLLGFWPQLLF
ncbi:hypothetical protein ACSHWB_10965 [Lentzea sp. HUAS TT2]|uniref:hypothetical protein n=1 Tax=Lentzea sp. HUAS TT2 TaxID=3447454 RepID=UPI003F70E728